MTLHILYYSAQTAALTAELSLLTVNLHYILCGVQLIVVTIVIVTAVYMVHGKQRILTVKVSVLSIIEQMVASQLSLYVSTLCYCCLLAVCVADAMHYCTFSQYRQLLSVMKQWCCALLISTTTPTTTFLLMLQFLKVIWAVVAKTATVHRIQVHLI
jgi:hypothetical protein